MSHHDEGSELHAVIRALCDEHRDTPSLSPSWLAMEAMQRIGFERQIHDLGWIGCNLQFRQIARVYCRKHFDPAERAQQPDFFPDTLQERYPLPPAGDAEPEYVRLELMDQAPLRYNVGRLRKVADASARHADTLEAWTDQKFRRAVG
jgi:hypothetical protein